MSHLTVNTVDGSIQADTVIFDDGTLQVSGAGDVVRMIDIDDVESIIAGEPAGASFSVEVPP